MLDWLNLGGELEVGEICLRLLCAMAVGLIIGTEREYTNRPAGMRTHILVALGACSVMITGQLIFQEYSGLGAAPDPARLGAQVITGVGFLGAGTILRDGSNVKGLTTAASLWAVACLGLAAGAGYYAVAGLGMVFIFATLTIFEVFQSKLVGPGTGLYHYSLVTEDAAACLSFLQDTAEKYRVGLTELTTQRQEQGTLIRFHGEIGGAGAKSRRRKFLEALASSPLVDSLRAAQDEKAGAL